VTDTRAIDLRFQGREKAICCHVVDGVLIDPGPGSCTETLLAALGDERPRAIALTHIHLDHAGGAGALAARWPGTPVYVHERGARHMVDPSRLLASAGRIYGDQMDAMWGPMVPVPEDAVRVLAGDGGDLGELGLRWAATPGHASHHAAFLDERSGVAYTGDVAGMRVDGGAVIPPTPPPDIDVEAWHASIDVVEGWRPTALALTHFGVHDDVAAHLSELRDALDALARIARDGTATEFGAEIDRRLGGGPDPSATTSSEAGFAGLQRYWQMRDNGAR
jgi:glyoxylase-like metal-dependent hydrolase (beta-lactamase superfamily II)